MDVQELRKEFPQLSQTVYGKPLVYLDNAATSLRPEIIIFIGELANYQMIIL